MVGHFVAVCSRRDLKFNADKSKGIGLNKKEGLEYELCVDMMNLEYMSEIKYLEFVLDESGTYEAEFRGKVASGRMFARCLRT